MAHLRSVNIGRAMAVEYADAGVTGIDKRPAAGPVALNDPASGSGVAGDAVCDALHHGGRDQAVYAYAWEDLLTWGDRLGEQQLRPGLFGENLTTEGVDVSGALVGERWAIGGALLEVTLPRIPCRTFAEWLDVRGWVKTFTREGVPGAYLRVVEPGSVRAGDAVTVSARPSHGITIADAFRALTTEPHRLPLMADVPGLPERLAAKAAKAAETGTAAESAAT